MANGRMEKFRSFDYVTACAVHCGKASEWREGDALPARIFAVKSHLVYCYAVPYCVVNEMKLSIYDP